MSSCVPCTHEMCTHMLQTHFDEKDMPFKCQDGGVCMATQGAFHTHYKKNHQGHMDKALGSRVNMTEQDFMPRHFLQVSMDESESGAY